MNLPRIILSFVLPEQRAYLHQGGVKYDPPASASLCGFEAGGEANELPHDQLQLMPACILDHFTSMISILRKIKLLYTKKKILCMDMNGKDFKYLTLFSQGDDPGSLRLNLLYSIPQKPKVSPC